jgi:hypothetical protein
MTGRALNEYRRVDGAPLEPLWADLSSRDDAARYASEELRNAVHALFRKWERANGFVEGAGQLLLPAGWSER